MRNVLYTLSLSLALGAGLLIFQGCTSSEEEERCPGDTSTLVVNLTAPAGVSPAVTISGPNNYSITLTGTDTLSGLAAGSYSVTYRRFKVAGSIVGKAYYGKISEPTFTLTACTPNTLTVEYLQEPGSERAYIIEGSSIKAFGAAKLEATGSPEPDNTLKSPAGPKVLAFDAWGNLWFSNAEGVFMYAMEDLAKADAVYKVKLTGSGVMGGGIPGAGPLAFDDEGSLWIGQIASDKIVKLTRDQLAVTGQPVPAVTLSNPDLGGVLSIAFDADGNLWATNEDDEVVQYSKARLAASLTTAADVILVHKSGPPVIGVYSAPQNLAFDGAGNLWIGFFAGNDLVKVPKTLQAASDTLRPDVSLKGGVTMLLDGLAFDASGGAWMPGSLGKMVKVAADGLAGSGAMQAAVVLTIPGFGNGDDIAFNPSPEALPLRD